MRKTDKKTDNQIRLALTDVCEIALKEIEGFEWLTHTVNYDSFPKSLKVTCIFDTQDNLNSFTQSAQNQKLSLLVQSKFQGLNISFKDINKQIKYDTEEACDEVHNGNWIVRLG
jgi:hypothetical protein